MWIVFVYKVYDLIHGLRCWNVIFFDLGGGIGA